MNKKIVQMNKKNSSNEHQNSSNEHKNSSDEQKKIVQIKQFGKPCLSRPNFCLNFPRII